MTEEPKEKKAVEKPQQDAVAALDQVPAADAASGGADQAAKPAAVRIGKQLKHVAFGIAHVRSTFNNTMIAITDAKGCVLAWGSSGRAGFKGSRKSTAYAAGIVGQDVARQALAVGMKEIEVRVQGPGAGRETAIRALQSAGINISIIKDVTPIPHNGCRARKRRRV